MSIIAVRDAWVAAIKAAVPGLRDCRAHGGRFDLEEVRNLAAKAPAVFVAALRYGRLTDNGDGTAAAPVQFAAYVLTVDQPGLERGVAAANLAEAVVVLVHANRLERADVGTPEDVDGQNLYAGTTDRHGFALWAVTWRQLVQVGESVFDAEGVLPEHLYLGWTPEIGAAHVDDYVEVVE